MPVVIVLQCNPTQGVTGLRFASFVPLLHAVRLQVIAYVAIGFPLGGMAK